MKAFRVALTVVVAVILAQAASGSVSRSVHGVRAGQTLVLTGRAFVPGERLTVTVFAGSRRTAALAVRADGTFVIRLRVLRGCLVWRAIVVGARSGRATFRSPTVECRPEPTWPPPPAGTGIAGSVRRGPIRPVCTVELPCDGPAPGVTVVVSQAAAPVATTVTDAKGHFVMQVPPGSYAVSALAPRTAPVDLQVRDGAYSRVTLSIDTGIR